MCSCSKIIVNVVYKCTIVLYMARENVFVFQIENIGTPSEKGSPPLAYIQVDNYFNYF